MATGTTAMFFIRARTCSSVLVSIFGLIQSTFSMWSRHGAACVVGADVSVEQCYREVLVIIACHLLAGREGAREVRHGKFL